MSGAARAFLVLNAGSSSLKFGLYAADDLAALCRGSIEAIGSIPKNPTSHTPALMALMASGGVGYPTNWVSTPSRAASA